MNGKLKSRNFLINSKNIERDSYIWNMAGTTLMAFQSVILLMVITRVISLEVSGVFSIAYALANLLLTIGKYGIHNFHVSDTAPTFSFGDYRVSRWITVAIMLLAAAGYSLFSVWSGNDSVEKGLTILWMCVFKAVDAVEDVYCSLYQQQKRLDVSGKVLTVRVVITMIFFGGCLIILRNLLVSLIITTVFTAALSILLNLSCRSIVQSNLKEKANGKRIRKLLVMCFPLSLMGFLAYYLSNAPKYAIDSMMSDEVQACYGFISMPVFVVGLMGNYLFNPVVRSLSEKWKDGDFTWFRKQMLKQAGIIFAITLLCIVAAYIAGIPVLSFLYSTDLSDYKAELLVMLGCGGFLAFSNQLSTIVTIIRKQKLLLIGYGLCSVLIFILAPIVVREYGIMGAALLELGLMLLLCAVFITIVVIEMRRAIKNKAADESKEINA